MFVLLFLLGISTALIAWLKWNYGHWRRNKVAGPDPSLIVGNVGPTLNFQEHPATLYDRWYRWEYATFRHCWMNKNGWFPHADNIQMCRTSAITKFWRRDLFCVIQISSRMCSSKIITVFIKMISNWARKSTRCWQRIHFSPTATTGDKVAKQLRPHSRRSE